MKSLLLAFLFVSTMFACDDSEALTPEDAPTIRYGTSFGMCSGYCLLDLEISPQHLYVSNYGWKHRVKTVTKTTAFQQEEYEAVLGMVDANDFLALQPVIGCPDCTDGGSEWIEITVNGRTKKVTFEYGAEINGIAEAVTQLRKLAEIYHH